MRGEVSTGHIHSRTVEESRCLFREVITTCLQYGLSCVSIRMPSLPSVNVWMHLDVNYPALKDLAIYTGKI